MVKYRPQLNAAFHRPKRPVGDSWRPHETYIPLKGKWMDLYRAVDKSGQPIDFLFTTRRDQKAAKRVLAKAIGPNALSEKMTIDKSGANAAAIISYNAEHGTKIHLRTCTYLNNIAEQAPRGVKRITLPMVGMHSLHAAHHTIVGIELMGMIKKGQMVGPEGEGS